MRISFLAFLLSILVLVGAACLLFLGHGGVGLKMLSFVLALLAIGIVFYIKEMTHD